MQQALKLHGKLATFVQQSEQMDADSFAVAYRAFLVSVQDCLGATGLDPFVIDWEELLFPDTARPEAMGPRDLHTPVSASRIAAPASTS